MKRYFLPLTAAFLITCSAGVAQDGSAEKNKSEAAKDAKGTQKNKKLDEYSEIIIKRNNPNVDEKVTVEIKGNEVFVDGKPIDEYTDNEVSVRLRSPNVYKLSPGSPFRNQNRGWSLESDEARDKPFLGVITDASEGGAKIISITENSAAAKAGLKKDDVIMKVNDKPIADHHELSTVIGSMQPEEKITITYKRDGKEAKTTATLGKRSVRSYRNQHSPDGFGGPVPPIPPVPPMEFNFDDFGRNFNIMGGQPRIGIKAQDTEDGKGVKVLDVDDDSPAAKSGIKENDIITSFDGKSVNSAEELAKLSRDSKDKTEVKVQLKRNGKNEEINLRVPKKLKTANL